MAYVAQHSRHEPGDLWDKFWKDSNGKVVVWQRPNIWLIVWAGLSVLSLFVPRGPLEAAFWWLSEAALAIWAVLEAWKGVNYFRRVLGIVVLLLVVISALKLA